MSQQDDRAGAPLKPKANMSDLGPRAASGVVMIAAALGATWAGGHVFNLFWIAAAFAVHWEWQRLAGGPNMMKRLVAGGAALALAAPLAHEGSPDTAIGLIAIASGLVMWLTPGRDRAFAAVGVLYAGALVVSTTFLRGSSLADGRDAILWLFAVVWGTDIMAYFGGRFIGGPKLWPRVSPSKTWSGFLVGVTSGALAGVLVVSLVRPQTELLPLFLLGWLAGAVAQGGDLLESSIKRWRGVKDSSHLIPGHGGVMDRVDGFVAAAALAALVGGLRAGLAAPAVGIFFW